MSASPESWAASLQHRMEESLHERFVIFIVLRSEVIICKNERPIPVLRGMFKEGNRGCFDSLRPQGGLRSLSMTRHTWIAGSGML